MNTEAMEDPFAKRFMYAVMYWNVGREAVIA